MQGTSSSDELIDILQPDPNPIRSVISAVFRSVKAFVSPQLSVKAADFEDTEPQIAHHVPESLEALCRRTKFKRREIQLIYRGFKQECPTGIVMEEKFKELYSQFFPLGDARQYASFVFSNLDHDMDGSITFEEFLLGMSLLSRGSIDEKLRWVFNLYDLNGDGHISPDELLQIVSSVYEMLGRHTEPATTSITVKEHVARIFAWAWINSVTTLFLLKPEQKMDQNGDGKISLAEFSIVCKQDRQISNSFNGLFDSIL